MTKKWCPMYSGDVKKKDRNLQVFAIYSISKHAKLRTSLASTYLRHGVFFAFLYNFRLWCWPKLRFRWQIPLKKSLPKFECFEREVVCTQHNKALAIYAEGCLVAWMIYQKEHSLSPCLRYFSLTPEHNLKSWVLVS